LWKIVENDKKIQKNKKLQDFHILCVLLDMKNNKLEFRYILQKNIMSQ
jgi:hypothetical protein